MGMRQVCRIDPVTVVVQEPIHVHRNPVGNRARLLTLLGTPPLFFLYGDVPVFVETCDGLTSENLGLLALAFNGSRPIFIG